MADKLRVVLVVLAAVVFSVAVTYFPLFGRRAAETGFAWEGQTVEIASNQMLSIQHRLGQGLVDFTDYRPNEAQYRYRFKNAETERETKGTGRVCINAGEWNGRGMASETSPLIQVGTLFLMWTNSGPNSSTVFYHSNRTHVAVLSNAYFEAFDFGKGNAAGLSNEEPSALSSGLVLILYVASSILSLTALGLLFMRFRFTFLIYLIISAAMGLAYMALIYWNHFFPSHSYSRISAQAVGILYTCDGIVGLVGLSGCVVYLLRRRRADRANVIMARR